VSIRVEVVPLPNYIMPVYIHHECLVLALTRHHRIQDPLTIGSRHATPSIMEGRLTHLSILADPEISCALAAPIDFALTRLLPFRLSRLSLNLLLQPVSYPGSASSRQEIALRPHRSVQANLVTSCHKAPMILIKTLGQFTTPFRITHILNIFLVLLDFALALTLRSSSSQGLPTAGAVSRPKMRSRERLMCPSKYVPWP